MKIALVAALAFALAPAAFAKGGKHCMGADGADLSSAASKAECKKAGGKWMKMKKPMGGGTGETTSPEGTSKPRPK